MTKVENNGPSPWGRRVAALQNGLRFCDTEAEMGGGKAGLGKHLHTFADKMRHSGNCCPGCRVGYAAPLSLNNGTRARSLGEVVDPFHQDPFEQNHVKRWSLR